MREQRAAVSKCFRGFRTKLMNTRSHPAECSEPSARSEEKASSKQSLSLCGCPAELHLQWTESSISEGTPDWEDRTGQEQRSELTNESGLSGAKHSDGTVFVVIPVTSTSSGEAGRHVEVGANESAYATTEEFYRQMIPWQRGVNQDMRGVCY